MSLFIGRPYHCFDELPSTNDHLAAMLAAGRQAEGVAVRALRQTAGRGQMGTRWDSEPNQNLTLSIALYPDFLDATRQFDLNVCVSLGLLDAVQTVLGRADARIKWPNDLYLGDRKTAGMLIQNTLTGSRLQTSIVGIGLNVNQQNFPPELPNATSLTVHSGQVFDLEKVQTALFDALEQRYLQLRAGNIIALRKIYTANLYGIGEPRRFARADGSIFSGSIEGIMETGLLQVRLGEDIEAFDLKELKFLERL